MEVIRDARLLGDEQLMKDVAAGCPKAKKDLIMRLYRRVSNTARYLCRTTDQAEDLTQEALLQILKSAGSFQASGCLEAWADVICVRTVRKKLGRHHRTMRVLGGELGDTPSADKNPEQRLAQKTVKVRVADLLGRLKPELQIALVLKLVYGYSVEEVAGMVGEPSSTVRYQLRKGRAELRGLVLKDGELREFLSGRKP